MNYNPPNEVAKIAVTTGEKKAHLSLTHILLLGFLAGAYIAFAGHVANIVTHDLTPYVGYGLTKLINGLVFSVGLILVVICGGELFTGNCLMLMGYAEGRFSLVQMLRNWLLVYLANLAGSLTVVLLAWAGSLFASHDSLIGAAIVKAASAKVSLTFTEALVRGIIANWLVCLGVWVGYAAQDVVGKITGIMAIITAFVITGTEHSIANMYTIPAGILLKNDPGVVQALGKAVALDTLSWTGMLRNLVPVTIGNIIGGSFLVGGLYSLSYRRPHNTARRNLTTAVGERQREQTA
ncbi:MAG: formate/nitrite transporter family protein [Bacillota bacterium]